LYGLCGLTYLAPSEAAVKRRFLALSDEYVTIQAGCMGTNATMRYVIVGREDEVGKPSRFDDVCASLEKIKSRAIPLCEQSDGTRPTR
jgi:hypothetical protein